MNYYLAKTDPDTYSIADLEREKQTVWDGVHNYQAIAVIKTMHPGDQVFVYHSQSDKAIVGLMEVTSEPYLNTKDPRFSFVVDVRFIKRYLHPVSLQQMNNSADFDGFILLRHSRLSTMSVPDQYAKLLQKLLN